MKTPITTFWGNPITSTNDEKMYLNIKLLNSTYLVSKYLTCRLKLISIFFTSPSQKSI
jgi:hypothetical protein